jgi:hypothetical protein
VNPRLPKCRGSAYIKSVLLHATYPKFFNRFNYAMEDTTSSLNRKEEDKVTAESLISLADHLKSHCHDTMIPYPLGIQAKAVFYFARNPSDGVITVYSQPTTLDRTDSPVTFDVAKLTADHAQEEWSLVNGLAQSHARTTQERLDRTCLQPSQDVSEIWDEAQRAHMGASNYWNARLSAIDSQMAYWIKTFHFVTSSIIGQQS